MPRSPDSQMEALGGLTTYNIKVTEDGTFGLIFWLSTSLFLFDLNLFYLICFIALIGRNGVMIL